MIICRKRDSTWKFATAEVGRQGGEDVDMRWPMLLVLLLSCSIWQLVWKLNATINFLPRKLFACIFVIINSPFQNR